MANNSVITTLGDIAVAAEHGFVDGPFGSNLPASAYTRFGVPVIRGSNLTLGDSRFRSDEFVFVSEESANRLSRSTCKPFDIIFTKKGTIGQTGLVPLNERYDRYLLSSNQMKLTVDPEKADPLFVYYYVSSPASREKVIRDSEATGVPKTNLAYFRSFPIRLPSLNEQRRIAEILGTLDDKIELNRRMNETLEALARRLFRSWFVDFDPVRVKATVRAEHPKWTNAQISRTALPDLAPEIAELFPDGFEDSTLGPIPKGWKAGTVGDIGDNPRRGVQPSEIEPTTPYIALEHMPRRCIALPEWEHADGVVSGKFQFHRGEILFGKLRPYFHKVGIAPIDGICSTDILVIVSQSPHWLALLVGHISSDEMIAHADASSTGTKMPRTNWKDLARFEIAIPPQPLAAEATLHVQSLLDRIHANIMESRNLELTRNRLLPRLLVGKMTTS